MNCFNNFHFWSGELKCEVVLLKHKNIFMFILLMDINKKVCLNTVPVFCFLNLSFMYNFKHFVFKHFVDSIKR